MQWLFQSRVSHLIAAVLAFIATCSILGYYSPVSIDSTPRRDRNDETGLFRIHDPVLDEQTIFRRDNATLDPYHCTKTIPCHTEACCGSFMGTDTGVCGFGPSFCGEDCTSQCDAKPECGQYADPPGKTCPLNVCCSKYGFCGSTHLFCDADEQCQSNCGHPSPPPGANPGPVTNRVIGYYESWSARRTCHPMPPSGIPIDGLTHVNFAFAYIDPNSFDITPMDSLTPASLFAQTADVRTLKSGNSDLEVFISIGGWTFSDNGTATQPVLGNIASTAENRQKFANNLVSFMQNYGFDGVDIDWEYPGAPDRGGHKADTENFVQLTRTLRETFDNSDRGSYGLTFTIPSSYWYLRWFDVPGLLKYADWANLMTYDLHGVWDKENPIGSVVLAHTNLTEIKQSVELLWRNDVPPEKVVLGLGFYGRSFELTDPSCQSPGCPFSGAAAPGTCTNSAGTLAYFEIQDIIADQKSKIVHDQEAAVNYLTFSNNQWVSWDDKITFKQKTDWANSVGLGGLMIWSIDQDDNQFSALTGLLGQNPGEFGSLKRRRGNQASGHWASENGQQCIETDCAVVPKCPNGYELAPFPEPKAFKDTCKKKQSRVICCPVDEMPQSCVWRGGERGRSCHGQCHRGESTIFHSKHATVDCLRPGYQAACCKASTYGDLIEKCHVDNKGWSVSKEQGKCTEPGYSKIANVIRPTDELRVYWHAVCCPDPPAFERCHWVGKGTCDDNECAASDVEAFLDTYGDSGACAGGLNGRKKALCCYPPEHTSPFLPVDLDKIFPTLPPITDIPHFDEQLLGADTPPVVDGPNQQTFGLVVIDGPAGTVTSLNRRDAHRSHLEVISCDQISEHGVSTVRAICPHDDLEKCDIGLGVVEGTILRMPDNCGPGSYVVAHAMSVSANQTIHNSLARALPDTATVFDISVSYDFSLAKRDSGDIYVRIDYSNSDDYWNKVVQGDPVTKRSLDKRFYSKGSGAWTAIYDNLRSDSSRGGEGSLSKENFHRVIIGDDGKKKQCAGGNNGDGFLSVNLEGSIVDRMNFGYTFVGTISPTFHIEEAYGYFDGTTTYEGSLNFDGKGKMDIEGGLRSQPLFQSPISKYAFNHPGICSLSPQLNVLVHASGSGHEVDAKFTSKFVGGTRGSTKVSQPQGVGSASGHVSNLALIHPFNGAISTSDGSSEQSSKRQADANDETIFAITMQLEALMNIQLNQFERSDLEVNSTWSRYTNSYVRIKGNGDLLFSNQDTGYQIDAPGGLPGWTAVEPTRLGPPGDTVILHTGTGTPDRDGAPSPDPAGNPLFKGSFMTCGSGGQPHGEGSETCACTALSNLTKFDPSLASEGSDGEDALARRGTGGKREFTVSVLEGDKVIDTFDIESHTYVNGENGEALLRANPNAGFYNGAGNADCNDNSIDPNSKDRSVKYVTEHVLELQYLKNLLNFFLAAKAVRADGSTYSQPGFSRVDSDLFYEGPDGDNGNYLQRPYRDWDANGPRTSDYGTDTPLDRLWRAFGDTTNPGHNLNAEKNLNGVKARIWKGNDPIANNVWKTNHFDRPRNCDDIAGATSAINSVFQTFNYLNSPEVGVAMATALAGLKDELEYFSERVNAVVPGAELPNLGEVHIRYFYAVQQPRIENVDAWVDRRLAPLIRAAEARAQNNPNDQDAQRQLRELREKGVRDTDDLMLDTTGYPSDVSDSEPDRRRQLTSAFAWKHLRLHKSRRGNWV